MEFAKTIGYEFVKRTKNTLEFNIFGNKVIYELLAILPFDTRKRMSVVVRNLDNQRIFVYTKGADSSILAKSLPYLYEGELRSAINTYARQGYRTLLFSYR